MGFVVVKMAVGQIFLPVLSPCPVTSTVFFHFHVQSSAKRRIGVSQFYHTSDILWLFKNWVDSGGSEFEEILSTPRREGGAFSSIYM
jgi:hypothetical protein